MNLILGENFGEIVYQPIFKMRNILHNYIVYNANITYFTYGSMGNAKCQCGRYPLNQRFRFSELHPEGGT